MGENMEGALGRDGVLNRALPVDGIDDSVVAIAAGALNSYATTSDGRLYEWGLLFDDVADDDTALMTSPSKSKALPGLSDRLNRNEYLRRIVMRSEAAYLANRNVEEVATEGIGIGEEEEEAGAMESNSAAAATVDDDPREPVEEPQASSSNSASSSSSSSSSPSPPSKDVSNLNSVEDILRIRLKRVTVPRPRRALGLDRVLVKSIAAGYAHSVAIDSSGNMWSAGYNDRGQLGLGNRIASASFQRIRVRAAGGVMVSFSKVACGQQHNAAVSSIGGSVFTWGSGTLGQLGLDSSRDFLTPTCISSDKFAVGASATLTSSPSSQTPAADPGGPPSPASSADTPQMIDVACGANHTVVLSAQGSVFVFGHSEYQQMGGAGMQGLIVGDASVAMGDLASTSHPRFYYRPRQMESLAGKRVTSISAGGQFSLALLEGGAGGCVSFGWDSYGCLGFGRGGAIRSNFGYVSGLKGKRILAVAAGYHHAAAVIAPEGHPFASSWLSLLREVNKTPGEAADTTNAAASPHHSAAHDGIQKQDVGGILPITSSSHAASTVAASKGEPLQPSIGRHQWMSKVTSSKTEADRVFLPADFANALSNIVVSDVRLVGGGSYATAGERSLLAQKMASRLESPSSATSNSSSSSSSSSSFTSSSSTSSFSASGSQSLTLAVGKAALKKHIPEVRDHMAELRGELAAAIEVMARKKTEKKMADETIQTAEEGASSPSSFSHPASSSSSSSSSSISTALPSVQEPVVVNAHSAMVSARCPMLAIAMVEAAGRHNDAVELSSPWIMGPGRAPRKITVTCVVTPPTTGVGKAADAADVTVFPPITYWSIHLPGANRVLLMALLSYLYADELPTIPLHLLPQLRSLSATLWLERLADLCDAQITFATLQRDAAAASLHGSSVTSHSFKAAATRSTFVCDIRSFLASKEGLYLSDTTITLGASDSSTANSSSSSCPPLHLTGHSLFLSRFEFFRNLFAHTTREGEGRRAFHVTIFDIDAVAFSECLDFVNTGDADVLRLDGSRCLRAISCAHRLCVPELESAAQTALFGIMTSEDAPGIREFAKDLGLHRLESHCSNLMMHRHSNVKTSIVASTK